MHLGLSFIGKDPVTLNRMEPEDASFVPNNMREILFPKVSVVVVLFCFARIYLQKKENLRFLIAKINTFLLCKHHYQVSNLGTLFCFFYELL